MKTLVPHEDRGQRAPIFCFVHKRFPGGDVVVYAMSQAGEILAAEYAENEYHGRVAIGLGSARNHNVYTSHYPKGYILMWVADGYANEELQRMNRINRQIDKIVDAAAQRMD